MRTYMIIPSYWCDEKCKWQVGDEVYDHPTPLNECGTLKRTLESLNNLKDKDFTVVILGAVTNDKDEPQMHTKLTQIIKSVKLPVDTILVTSRHLNRIKEALQTKCEIPDILHFGGYSNIRNLCLLVPYILDAEVALLIDDDEVFEDPYYVRKAREFIGRKFYGNTVDGVAGYYLNEDNEYYDKVNIEPWMTYWDRFGEKREAFDKIIGSEPRLKKTPFAFGGAMVIHRNLMRIVPFDPKTTRGEDTDYVVNARIFGFNFFLDNTLAIKHLPPKKKHPVWKRFREDIYRFLYAKSKFETQYPKINLHEIKPEDFDPYPGEFMKPDLGDKIFKTNIILALNYLSDNKIEDCKETINNIYLAKYDAKPKGNTFGDYLDFQKQWRNLLESTKEFGETLQNILREGTLVKYDKYQIQKMKLIKEVGLKEDYAPEKLELFKDLTKPEIRKILEIHKIKHYNPGDYVFHEDETDDNIYIVLKGNLEVMKTENGNEPLVVAELMRGEHFNETSMFIDSPHNVSIIARTVVELMILDKHEFISILKTNEKLYAKIMWKISTKLVKRLVHTTKLFTDIKELDADVSDQMEE